MDSPQRRAPRLLILAFMALAVVLCAPSGTASVLAPVESCMEADGASSCQGGSVGACADAAAVMLCGQATSRQAMICARFDGSFAGAGVEDGGHGIVVYYPWVGPDGHSPDLLLGYGGGTMYTGVC
jgi:hypothetical protein